MFLSFNLFYAIYAIYANACDCENKIFRYLPETLYDMQTEVYPAHLLHNK